jgi:hypothetical protein
MLFRHSLIISIVVTFLGGTLLLRPAAAEDKPAAVQQPLCVMLFDDKCKAWCAQVRPMMAELKTRYGDKVEFAEIDVSPSTLQEAKKKAKELRIGSLLADAIGYVPIVIICSPNRKGHHEFMGPKNKDAYEDCLKKLLAKEG